MRRTASANGKSRSNSVRGKRSGVGYVMCIDNEGYPVSLEIGKVYRTLPGNGGVSNWIRVIDESGEDYLYPAKRFVAMQVPPKGRRALAAATR
jgi:hypothetical protein